MLRRSFLPLLGFPLLSRAQPTTACHMRWIDPAAEGLRLIWNSSPKGETLKSLLTIHPDLTFVMNAGIFEAGWKPEGLWIEDGKEKIPLNRKDGKGNFYLKPGGVFYVDKEGKAAVVTVEECAAHPPAARYATQSGPILLRHGKRHHAFRQGSPNLRVRNGVGVNRDGKILCALSRQPMSFWDFAGFFLDNDCPDALFLDGDLSIFWEKGDSIGPTSALAGFLVLEPQKK